ncbi:MAG: hypothetical protein V4629_12145 [Pseudomonadota bacterium]
MTVSNRPASFNANQSLKAHFNPLPRMGRLYSIAVAVLGSNSGFAFGISAPFQRTHMSQNAAENYFSKSKAKFFFTFDSQTSKVQNNLAVTHQNINSSLKSQTRFLQTTSLPNSYGENNIITNCSFNPNAQTSVDYDCKLTNSDFLNDALIDDNVTINKSKFAGPTEVQYDSNINNSNFLSLDTSADAVTNFIDDGVTVLNSDFEGPTHIDYGCLIKNVHVKQVFYTEEDVELFIENQKLVFLGNLTIKEKFGLKFYEFTLDQLNAFSTVSANGSTRTFNYHITIESKTQIFGDPIEGTPTPAPSVSATPAPVATSQPTMPATAKPTVLPNTPAPTSQPNKTQSPSSAPATVQPTTTAEPVPEPEKTEKSKWERYGIPTISFGSGLGFLAVIARRIVGRIFLALLYRSHKKAIASSFRRNHFSNQRTRELQNTVDFFERHGNVGQHNRNNINFLGDFLNDIDNNQLFDPITRHRARAYFSGLVNHLTQDLLTIDTVPGEFIKLALWQNIAEMCSHGNAQQNNTDAHVRQNNSQKGIIGMRMQNVLLPELPTDDTYDQVRRNAKSDVGLTRMLQITAAKLTLASIPQLIAEKKRLNPSRLHQIEVSQHRGFAHYDSVVENHNKITTILAQRPFDEANQIFHSIQSRAKTSATELAREDFFQIIKFLRRFSENPINLTNLNTHINGNPPQLNVPIYQRKLYVLSNMMTSVVLNQFPYRLQRILNRPADSADTIRVQAPKELQSLRGFSQDNMDRLTDTLSTPDFPGPAQNAVGTLNEWDRVAAFLGQP